MQAREDVRNSNVRTCNNGSWGLSSISIVSASTQVTGPDILRKIWDGSEIENG